MMLGLSTNNVLEVSMWMKLLMISSLYSIYMAGRRDVLGFFVVLGVTIY